MPGHWMETAELYVNTDFFTVSVCSTTVMFPTQQSDRFTRFKLSHLVLVLGRVWAGMTVPTGCLIGKLQVRAQQGKLIYLFWVVAVLQ